MSRVFVRLRLVAVGLGVLAAGSVADASVMSLKAVKQTRGGVDTPFSPPRSNLAVLGGDIIEAEILLSNWANDFPMPTTGVRIFQARINQAGYLANDNGHLTPLGWCRPFSPIACPPDCPAAFPTCDESPFIGCRCTNGHNPALGGFITHTRSDFLLFNLDPIREVDLAFLGYKYFALAPDSAVLDVGATKYLATLKVTVSANACGTFIVGFDPDQTFIGDAADPANTSIPTFQSLTLDVSDCARQLLSCDPVHCNIDARKATNPKTGAAENRNAIEMTFSKSTAGMAAGDFEVSLLPVAEGELPPNITAVTQDAGNPNKTRVVFIPRMRQSRWTCFLDKSSRKRCCMGSLPGDVNNSQISNLQDVFEAVTNLNGGINPILAVDKCDTDRSLLCAPADLLMVVDLLNGADLFDPKLNKTLPVIINNVCNDMRVPPP